MCRYIYMTEIPKNHAKNFEKIQFLHFAQKQHFDFVNYDREIDDFFADAW